MKSDQLNRIVSVWIFPDERHLEEKVFLETETS